MRKHKNNKDFILTRKKAAEIFCILSFARPKLSGKIQTNCEKYWKEFEKALDLEININSISPKN